MEERVARIVKETAQLLPVTISDQDVAAQIKAELQKRKQKLNEYGVYAYTESIVPSQNINKGFLLNTIRSVDTHNRRQEIDACYRKRDLERKIDYDMDRHRSRRKRSRSCDRDASKSHSRNSKRKSSPIPLRDRESKTDAACEREYWANRKAQKTQVIRDVVGDRELTIENAPNYASSSDSEENKGKKSKKKKKSKEKSKKKKKSTKNKS